MKTKHLFGIIAIIGVIISILDKRNWGGEDDLFFLGLFYIASWLFIILSILVLIIENWNKKIL